jgi:hypothetical protein
MIYQLSIHGFERIYKDYLCRCVFYQIFNEFVLVKQAIPDYQTKVLLKKYGMVRTESFLIPKF